LKNSQKTGSIEYLFESSDHPDSPHITSIHAGCWGLAGTTKEVKPGDTVRLRQGAVERTVVVQGLSGVRGPAPVAQLLYTETPESIAARQKAAEQDRLAREPALSIEQGRPTKRDRRQIDRNWNDRWSAGID